MPRTNETGENTKTDLGLESPSYIKRKKTLLQT